MKIDIPSHIWDALVTISEQEGVNPEDAAIGMLTELLESTGALVPIPPATISVKLPHGKRKLKAQGTQEEARAFTRGKRQARKQGDH